MRGLILATCIAVLATPGFAVLPDEVLDDPVLEQRARELSKDIRCLVCRNESIDESNAELARDLRILVRERLTLGESDDEVMAYLVARYGEYVLLNPPASGSTLLLWGAPLALLLLGGGVAAAHIRGQRKAPVAPALSDEEEAKLKDLLRE